MGGEVAIVPLDEKVEWIAAVDVARWFSMWISISSAEESIARPLAA